MITVDMYERAAVIANSLRSITLKDGYNNITGSIEDRFRKSIVRYVGEDNAKNAEIFRLADFGDKLYILAVIDDDSKLYRYSTIIQCIVASSGALRQYRDAQIIISGRGIYDSVYNVYRVIMNLYGFFKNDDDLISIGYCVLNQFKGLYTDNDITNIAKDIAYRIIFDKHLSDKYYITIKYALKEMIHQNTIPGFVPDIYTISNALEYACKYTGNDTFMNPNRSVIWGNEKRASAILSDFTDEETK